MIRIPYHHHLLVLYLTQVSCVCVFIFSNISDSMQHVGQSFVVASLHLYICLNIYFSKDCKEFKREASFGKLESNVILSVSNYPYNHLADDVIPSRFFSFFKEKIMRWEILLLCMLLLKTWTFCYFDVTERYS